MTASRLIEILTIAKKYGDPVINADADQIGFDGPDYNSNNDDELDDGDKLKLLGAMPGLSKHTYWKVNL